MTYKFMHEIADVLYILSMYISAFQTIFSTAISYNLELHSNNAT